MGIYFDDVVLPLWKVLLTETDMLPCLLARKELVEDILRPPSGEHWTSYERFF